MNTTLAMRRILSLTVLLATGVAQAMATACPMGIAGGGDHPVVHFGSAPVVAGHDHHAAASSHAHHRVSPGGDTDGHVVLASAPRSRAPLDTGVPCALTMSCAPLIPAPCVPLGILGRAAGIVLPSASSQLLSVDINTATPPPRLLA